MTVIMHRVGLPGNFVVISPSYRSTSVVTTLPDPGPGSQRHSTGVEHTPHASLAKGHIAMLATQDAIIRREQLDARHRPRPSECAPPGYGTVSTSVDKGRKIVFTEAKHARVGAYQQQSESGAPNGARFGFAAAGCATIDWRTIAESVRGHNG
jgi:hypothetical protein